MFNYTIRLASSAGCVVNRFFTALNITSNSITTAYSIIEIGGSNVVDSSQSIANNGSAVVNITNATSTVQIQVVLGLASGTMPILNTFCVLTLTRIG